MRRLSLLARRYKKKLWDKKYSLSNFPEKRLTFPKNAGIMRSNLKFRIEVAVFKSTVRETGIARYGKGRTAEGRFVSPDNGTFWGYAEDAWHCRRNPAERYRDSVFFAFLHKNLPQ